ncbi:hypothetical protein H5410_064562 [Solanum commersonii]|uniref:Uncharacterized protein n=1 Tax=Solanum commersonii TaxID=4109 RepID=A0A9J5VZ26_SOLCO|nr:hypothetical protein H5410_064562 [Solanum commersonii]
MDSFGFYNSSIGLNSDTVSVIAQCRGDVQLQACRDCITNATRKILEAFGYYDRCMLRYSNESIIGNVANQPGRLLYNGINASSSTEFMEDLRTLLESLRSQASQGGKKKYASNSTQGPDFQTIYALVQCSADLSAESCINCLSDGYQSLPLCSCYGKRGVNFMMPSCNFRYEIYPFFDELSTQAPPPLSPPPPPSPLPPPPSGIHGDDISTAESFQYDFSTIRAATDNFLSANKLGQGGFGPVYKGKLPNSQEVAVKRLSADSGQGDLEFKNEVMLVARLQHRNLVRLLGFCLDGTERLLVYEFFPNASLDQFLFDPVKRRQLDWEKRSKIIGGVAKGILYLHEDSRLHIIHRDLKASNVLLDEEMNPKIADFGMARLFTLDETQGNTSRIVGTYGYMAPEYAMHGQFSVKSDVFSFGVLILEILSGQKNTCFRNGESVEDLLNYAWTNWQEGTATNLIDPMFRGSSGLVRDIMRYIHIALLCVQENIGDRPTMAAVVLMLSSLSLSLPVPSGPAYYTHDDISPEISLIKEYNSRSSEPRELAKSKSISSSRNEASITELYPRTLGDVESLQYDFSIIREATDNFSNANKLGQGGFGPVYKGKLQNGQEVAVKRLSADSGKHRNLVRLLGFCLDGTERLLFYEFVPNASLDQFLFDQVKRSQLDWERRSKIIGGIARGIVYLHEDSRLRIIHRDLKAGNVLLDAEMNPKIADQAWQDYLHWMKHKATQTELLGLSNGYMAPEYAMQGQFSVKSDVYSFGVLVLEIISGQRNICSRKGDSVEDLLRVVISNLIDPMLRGRSGPVGDIVRYIHIALLCVQEKVANRPNMGEVLLMLSSRSLSLPVPHNEVN